MVWHQQPFLSSRCANFKAKADLPEPVSPTITNNGDNTPCSPDPSNQFFWRLSDVCVNSEVLPQLKLFIKMINFCHYDSTVMKEVY